MASKPVSARTLASRLKANANRGEESYASALKKPLFMVTTRLAAAALAGSKDAIKSAKRITVYGQFVTRDRAEAFITENKMGLYAGIAEV